MMIPCQQGAGQERAGKHKQNGTGPGWFERVSEQTHLLFYTYLLLKSFNKIVQKDPNLGGRTGWGAKSTYPQRSHRPSPPHPHLFAASEPYFCSG